MSESQRAAKKCFQAWLEHCDGAQNQERTAILTQVRGFKAHGAGRLELIGLSNQQILNRVGFKKIEHDKT